MGRADQGAPEVVGVVAWDVGLCRGSKTEIKLSFEPAWVVPGAIQGQLAYSLRSVIPPALQTSSSQSTIAAGPSSPPSSLRRDLLRSVLFLHRLPSSYLPPPTGALIGVSAANILSRRIGIICSGLVFFVGLALRASAHNVAAFLIGCVLAGAALSLTT